MITIKELSIDGYEKVIEGIDEENHLHCFIAIHNTTLGPALGGMRVFPYENRENALKDALLLAKAMTKKSALAGLGFGGGKSVIIADPKMDKNEKLLTAFAEVVNSLQGKYIAAEDVGSSVGDMTTLRKTTPYVAALATKTSSGDPSPYTAWGVFMAIKATAKKLWGSSEIKGKIIAIQGLGHVGFKLAEFLFWNGADLIVADIDHLKSEKIHKLYGAKVVSPKDIYSEKCDIFAPCAMGGGINPDTIPTLNCKAIVGAANNQLSNSEDGNLLSQRKILYAPDFITNAGGIINASLEFSPEGYNPKIAKAKVDKIYDTLLWVYEKAESENKLTVEVADELADYNLKNKIDARIRSIIF